MAKLRLNPSNSRGAALTEYALLVLSVAVLGISALSVFGPKVNEGFNQVAFISGVDAPKTIEILDGGNSETTTPRVLEIE